MLFSDFVKTTFSKPFSRSLILALVVGHLSAGAMANQIKTSENADTKKCSEFVSATYKVTTENKAKDKQAQINSQTLQIWRNQQQIAYVYPESHMTELWEQTHNGRLHLTRYFNEYQRGIEYQPNEIKGGKDWSMKRHFVSESLLSEMNLQQTQGQGCLTLQTLSLEKGQQHYQMQWYNQLKLIKSFTISTEGSVVRWDLLELQQQKNMVIDYFATLSSFETTDYIDIGDNESDPFLRKMINLGFVEHSHSGFYDSEGHSMSNESQHHH